MSSLNSIFSVASFQITDYTLTISSSQHLKDTGSDVLHRGTIPLIPCTVFFFLFLILYHSSRCCWCPVQNPINGQGTCCPSCCECWLLISHSYPPFYRIGLSNLAKSLCPLLPTQGQPTARYSLTEYKRLIPARPTSFLSSLPWPTLPLSLPFTWAPSPNKSCVPTFFLRLYFYGTWPMIIIQHITFIYL